VYKIGGWETDEPAADVSLSPFWIARFPITVAQFAPFVEQGYSAEAERWWTPEGWKWRNQRDRLAPWGWDDPAYSGANQPVIGVTWYEATAFCAWLSEQFAVALPRGYVLRLPSEAEWEAAAAYDAQMQRRTYPWGEAEPTTELAIYDASGLQRPAPVGCCPAGAAACGALDLAGNVWEMTTSSVKAYPAQSGVIKEDFTPRDFDVPFRGGSYYQNSTSVRCGARLRNPPGYVGIGSLGFRIVLAPFHSR
jgi:formylglycine-generating enzyme required for sulfatase activity